MLEALSVVVTATILLITWQVIGDKLRGRQPLPPGPRGLPIIGNILEMPKDCEWLHWSNHKDVYGRCLRFQPRFLLLEIYFVKALLAPYASLGRV